MAENANVIVNINQVVESPIGSRGTSSYVFDAQQVGLQPTLRNRVVRIEQSWHKAGTKRWVFVPYYLFITITLLLTTVFLALTVAGLVMETFLLSWTTSLVALIGSGSLAITGILSLLKIKQVS